MNRKQVELFIHEVTLGAEEEKGIMLCDGMDKAFIGLSNDDNIRAVYSADKIIKLLCKESVMSVEEAWEYFYFNIERAYVGEKTPIYIRTP